MTEIAGKVDELQERGYCVLESQLNRAIVDACRDAFWPVLTHYLERHGHEPNRGAHRHFVPMPFDPPCFAPELFFDPAILGVVRGVMGPRTVADQWGCDVPVHGSEYQGFHVDYRRPLFEEDADLLLPPYMLVVSFGLVPVTAENGPIEIAEGTHRMPRMAAIGRLERGEQEIRQVLLQPGDVLIRHPWTIHRGTPNHTGMPRPMVSIRYVRRWYMDDSRDVEAIPRAVWRSLTAGQRGLLRFPIRG